jgi:hypothetical protein
MYIKDVQCLYFFNQLIALIKNFRNFPKAAMRNVNTFNNKFKHCSKYMERAENVSGNTFPKLTDR